MAHPNVGLTRITESPMAMKLDGMNGADSQCIQDCSAGSHNDAKALVVLKKKYTHEIWQGEPDICICTLGVLQ